MEKHKIKNIFFIKDKGLIIIHLIEFNRDFKSYGTFYLCYAEQRIKMNYIGFGNHEGNPALLLQLDDNRYNSINEIESEVKNTKRGYFLER